MTATQMSGYERRRTLAVAGSKSTNPEPARDVGRAAPFLLRLINDVLTAARHEEARPLRPTTIVVSRALADIEELCELEAKAKGVTLSFAPQESEILVAADARRLQQVLLNLVTNAIKFTGPHGSIAVTCESDTNVARIRVKGTGGGIAATDVERVFDPFIQINRHPAPPTQQGIWRGLATGRDFARAMRGDLTLDSVAGVGSMFTLTLPSLPTAVV